jgi:3',5'-cyclic AMP phosphodiesterase CpdA
MTHGNRHDLRRITRRQFLRRLGLTTGAALVAPASLRAEHPDFEPFTFVQLSDTHVGRSALALRTLARAIEAVASLQPTPDFLVITGDLAERAPRHYRAFFDVLGRLPVPHYLVPGNHDVGNRISERTLHYTERYREMVGPDRYTFDIGTSAAHARFIVLNSLFMRPWAAMGRNRRDALAAVVEEQWTWLEEQLRRSESPDDGTLSVFVCLHHPLFSTGPAQRLASYLTTTMKAKERMLELCTRHRVQALLSGHAHRSRVCHYRDVALINSPSVFWNTPEFPGGPLPLGFRVFEVKSSEVSWRYKTLDTTGISDLRVKLAKQSHSSGEWVRSLEGHAWNPRALTES